jgi:hypothetical protein
MMLYTHSYAWLSSDRFFSLFDLATLSDYSVQHSYLILTGIDPTNRITIIQKNIMQNRQMQDAGQQN